MTIPRGQNGINGTNGVDGTTPVFSSTTSTSTLSAGSSATASISGSGTSSNPYKFSFGIPRGYTGSTGSQGPTGPSAISASSMTTNGYIKFTNGFTISWQKVTGTDVTFPITFSSVYTIILQITIETISIIWPQNITTSSCKIYRKGPNDTHSFAVSTSAITYVVVIRKI